MLTPAKRFMVRTLLVTGCTLSTLIGVQALASLDAAKSSAVTTNIVAPGEPARTETLVPMFDLPASSVATGQAQAPTIQIVTGTADGTNTTSQAPAIQIVTAASQIQRVDPASIQPRTEESK